GHPDHGGCPFRIRQIHRIPFQPDLAGAADYHRSPETCGRWAARPVRVLPSPASASTGWPSATVQLWRAGRTSVRPRSITGPLILVTIGLLFLLNNVRPDLLSLSVIERYWPFLLIGAGAIGLIEVLFHAA